MSRIFTIPESAALRLSPHTVARLVADRNPACLTFFGMIILHKL